MMKDNKQSWNVLCFGKGFWIKSKQSNQIKWLICISFGSQYYDLEIADCDRTGD